MNNHRPFPRFVAVIALAIVSIAAPVTASATCYIAGSECTGLFDETASNQKRSKLQKSLDPEPFFEPIINDNLRRVTVCEKNNQTVGTAVTAGGQMKGETKCGSQWKKLVSFWQRIGEPKRIEPGQETEEKITLDVELQVGTTYGGGLITAKAKVGAKWEYTLKYTTYAWECLYRPVVSDEDKEFAGDCGFNDSLLPVNCKEP